MDSSKDEEQSEQKPEDAHQESPSNRSLREKQPSNSLVGRTKELLGSYKSLKIRNETTRQLRCTVRVPVPPLEATTTRSLTGDLEAGFSGVMKATVSAKHTREHAQRHESIKEWPQDVMLRAGADVDFEILADSRAYVELALVVSKDQKDDVHLSTRAVRAGHELTFRARNLFDDAFDDDLNRKHSPSQGSKSVKQSEPDDATEAFNESSAVATNNAADECP